MDILEKIGLFVVIVFGLIAVNAVMGLVIAFPVMWLWNWLLTDLFHWPVISYWQAYGLYLLCTILFKSNVSNSSK